MTHSFIGTILLNLLYLQKNQNNYSQYAFLVGTDQTQTHVQRHRGTVERLTDQRQRLGGGVGDLGGDSTGAGGTVPPCCHWMCTSCLYWLGPHCAGPFTMVAAMEVNYLRKWRLLSHSFFYYLRLKRTGWALPSIPSWHANVWYTKTKQHKQNVYEGEKTATSDWRRPINSSEILMGVRGHPYRKCHAREERVEMTRPLDASIATGPFIWKTGENVSILKIINNQIWTYRYHLRPR